MRRAAREFVAAARVPPGATAAAAAAVCVALLWGAAVRADASVPQRPPTDGPVKAASEAILSGDSVRASALLDPLVRSNPRDLEARGLLALSLYLSNRWFQAEGQAYTLRQQDPSGRETAFLVSRRLLAVFRMDTPAAAQLIDLLARGGADGFLWLAQIYDDRGRYGDAATILTRGVSRFPASAPLLDALGFNAWKAGQQATAIAAYRQAILLQPNSWERYFNLGWVYYSGRQYPNAAAAWREALRLNPAHPALPKLIADAEHNTRHTLLP
jgi:tetratricopeptide (TPR) repeat protein